jgi:hypothetical protein
LVEFGEPSTSTPTMYSPELQLLLDEPGLALVQPAGLTVAALAPCGLAGVCAYDTLQTSTKINAGTLTLNHFI